MVFMSSFDCNEGTQFRKKKHSFDEKTKVCMKENKKSEVLQWPASSIKDKLTLIKENILNKDEIFAAYTFQKILLSK